MAKLIPLEYQGMPIQANSDAWFNATDMAAIYGKKVHEYLRLPVTTELIAALCDVHNAGKSRFIKSKRGKNGGTWLSQDLAVDFAAWLDVRFRIWMLKTITNLLANATSWNQEREMVKAIQGVFTDTMKALAESKGTPAKWYDYKNECCRINRALTGKWDKLERDGLSKPQLKIIREMVAYDIALLSQNKTTEEREQLLAAKAFVLCGGQLLEVQA